MRRTRFSRPTSVWTAVAAAVGWLALAGPATAPAQIGTAASSAIAQLAGTDGCVMQVDEDIDHGCARAGALAEVAAVAVSPDDRFVYAVAGGTLNDGTDGILTFARTAGTGALRPVGCITANGGDGRVGSEGLCERGDALVGARDIAISPDGENAYVASSGSGGLAWLKRDKLTGRLTPSGCVKDTPRADRCSEMPNLLGASAVAVSPDGNDVYVAAATSGALHAFEREPATGRLVHVQCLSETGSDGACEAAPALQAVTDLAMAPDGKSLYAAGISGAVARFARDPQSGTLRETACLLESAPGGGPCRDAAGIDGAAGVAVSPDSRDLYVAASGSEAVTSFRAGPEGALSQTGCIARATDVDGPSDSPVEAGCTAGTEVWEPVAVAASADGRTVYAAGLDTVTSYRRDPASGAFRQTGCAEEDNGGFCQAARAIDGVRAVAVTSDGTNVYTASDSEHAVAAFGVTVSVDPGALTLRRDAVPVVLRCPRVVARACAGTVAIAAGRRAAVAGRARTFRLRPGARATVAVAAPSSLRSALRLHRAAPATVRVTDGRGVLERLTRRVTVHRG
jgi:DNA-binding beta-propeller fold protein YncE